jgi:ABC-type Fe3+-hydroxamate transport system substrate-binding protein
MATSGVNFLPEYEATMADIPDVTVAETGDLNLELIASLQPDLIIGSDWLDPAKQLAPYDQLTAIAPTALCEWQQAAGNWPDQAAFFADVVGRTPELEAVKATYETSADSIKAEHAEALAAQTWALVQGGADGQWFFYTPHSSHGQVFARAGIQFADINSDEPGGFVAMSTENIGDLAAASALALNMNVSATAGGEALQAEPLFQALPAAQDGQVYPMTWFFPSSYQVASALLVEIDDALAKLEANG